jgi:uracil-DNA glycosylase
MSERVPPKIMQMLKLADPSWRDVLERGLDALAQAHPAYLSALLEGEYLPTEGRIFAAFVQPLGAVRYVLVGEGPYPRPESATGFCFMDGAVDELWSVNGLSKPVNRATSLRNFMKMLLVAAGELHGMHTGAEAMARIAAKARAPGLHFIQTRADLQQNLTSHGFLLLNASLVFRPEVAPLKEAKAWTPFLQTVLDALADRAAANGRSAPTLVLWGKVAEALDAVPANSRFPKAVSEHPYNLSFIGNPVMQSLFGPMRLLEKPALSTKKGI